jgi:hypothetical protein
MVILEHAFNIYVWFVLANLVKLILCIQDIVFATGSAAYFGVLDRLFNLSKPILWNGDRLT